MKIKHLKQIFVSSICALLILGVSLLTPSVVKAQADEYKTEEGVLVGTSDSRLAINIVEEGAHVMLQVMGIGEMFANGVSFTLVYQPNSLKLTDNTFASEVPIAVNPSDFGGAQVIYKSPFFETNYPHFYSEVMGHREITGSAAAGMRSLYTTVAYMDSDTSRFLKINSKEMVHLYTLYFKKVNESTPLQASDFGFYSQTTVPPERMSSKWAYGPYSVRFSKGGNSEMFDVNSDIFMFRSSSAPKTNAVSEIAKTAAKLNGNFVLGTLAEASNLIVVGAKSATNTGLLKNDTVSKYGFIYSAENTEILVNGISEKLNIGGADYDFPTAKEITAKEFTRGGKTFYIGLTDNTSSSQSVNYDLTLSGLTAGTNYYAWSFIQYAFETSDTYLAVGEKVSFKTEEETCTPPSVPTGTTPQDFCAGATVADLVATGTSIKWYAAASGGTALASTEELVDGTTYYAASTAGTTCESTSRLAVVANVGSVLSVPTGSTPQEFCAGATVADLVATGTSIKWYAAASGGTALASTEELVDGTTYYAASTAGTTCESTSRLAVVANVGSVLSVPTGSTPQEFCAGATVADLVATGTSIKWYAAASGGTALASTEELVDGTTYYAASTAGTTCESTSRLAVVANVGSVLSVPTGSTPQEFCAGATVADLVATGTSIKWYAAASGGTALASTEELVDGTTYYAASTAGTTCESTSRLVVVANVGSVLSVPTGSTPQEFCAGATVADLVATGTSIKWYAAASGGTALASTEELVDGTTYYAASTAGSCESATRLEVVANVGSVLSVPTGTTPQEFCTGATVADLVATGTSIKWYTAATGGTALASTVALVDGTTYYAASTAGSCESATRLEVVANVGSVLSVPTGTTPQEFCTGATVADLVATGTSIKWYTAATGGTALASTVALVDGTTYYAASTAGSCESATRLEVVVNVGSVLSVPTGSTPQEFCTGATVADLVATGTSIKWYAAASGGTALASTVALVDGTSYYAASTAGSCESATRLEVLANVGNVLSVPTGSTPQEFCTGATVADLVATGTSIKWYTAATGGTALASTEELVDGTSYYAASTAGSCESATRLEVVANVGSVLSVPTGSTPQEFCTGATVADLVATGTSIKWYTAASGGTALASTEELVDGTTYYAASTAGTTCESTSRLAVVANVGSVLSVPTGSTPQEFCAGATVADLVATGTSIKWYAAASGGTALASTVALVDGTSYYAASTAGSCESTSRLAVVANVGSVLSEPTGTTPQELCAGATVADLVATGSNVKWFATTSGGIALAGSTVLVNGATYYAASTEGNCESTSRFGVDVIINMTTQPAISNIDVCSNAGTFDLSTAVTKELNHSYTYYSDNLGTMITDPELVSVPASNSVYYVKAKTSGECSTDYITINVIVNSAPEVSVSPAGAYTTLGNQVVVNVTDNNTSVQPNAKKIEVKDETIATATLLNGEITVKGEASGNTEIRYTSVSDKGCTTVYVIPVQIGGASTGIITGKDIVKCNLPGGGDTAIVQIAHIMGGVAPWTVTISDDRGTFTKDTLVKTLNDLPINVTVIIPENKADVPEYTNYAITKIVDAANNEKLTHYGSVRIGTNPTPKINTIASKDQIVCAGTSTLPISFDGVATRYRWSIDQNIGTINYLDNAIPSFVAVNETNQSIETKIAVTPEYWYNGLVCIGKSDTAIIRVLPKLEADFTTAVAGLGKIQFAGISSTNVLWLWSFGDGATSAEQSPLHTYTDAGTYKVTLTVTDDNRCVSSVSKQIAVSNNTDLEAKFSINDAEQCLTGNSFIFSNISKITTQNHSINSFSWNFGDGTTNSADKNPTHTYASAGVYNVTLLVTETPTGTQSSVSQTVKVVGTPSITDPAIPASVCEGGLLRVGIPTISWNRNTPVQGTWLLGGNVFDPTTTAVTIFDDNKLLQYNLNTSCGNVTSIGVAVKVNTAPVVENILDVAYCAGEQIPTQILGSEIGVTYRWKQTGDNIGLSSLSGTNNIPAFEALNNTSRSLTATFEVIPFRGTCQGNAEYFNIIVNPNIAMISRRDMGEICSDITFDYALKSNIANVVYNWTRPAIAGINNGIAKDGTGAKIEEQLSNHTDAPITVKYFVEMLYNDCEKKDSVTVVVNPTPYVTVPSLIAVCDSSTEVSLAYTLNPQQQELSIRYNITFDNFALLAGFTNITDAVLENGSIKISLPGYLSSGNYGATLTMNIVNGCTTPVAHPFHIQIGGAAQIVKQPESVSICNNDGFSLSVSAIGQALSYQWYKGIQLIPGATSPVYTVDVSDSSYYGNYHVVVTSACGDIISQKVEVVGNRLNLLSKWEDVVFISNANKLFIAYQWYKNGKPIPVEGNYQSYSEKGGLNGTYEVLVTYADGTSDMSCPFTVNNTKSIQKKISIYPNPVLSSQELTIDVTDFDLGEFDNAKLEIFDVTGKQILKTNMTTSKQKVKINTPMGAYVVRITTVDGRVVVEKIIVR